MENPVIVTIELFPQEAWDYAQFLKRVGFADYMANASDKEEAYRMLAVGEKIRDALAAAGFKPR